MALDNLPGVVPELVDNGLALTTPAAGPSTLIIGTAASGPSDTLYRVTQASDAVQRFGREGTLTRGMFEAKGAGSENLLLFRIGASAASVEGIGAGTPSTPAPTDEGISIETIDKDDSMGEAYKFAWDNTAKRLQVRRSSDDIIVYDNLAGSEIDLGEVVVSGSYNVGEGLDIGDIGTEDFKVLCPDDPGDRATFESTYEVSCTPGTDGTNLSRMEMWEALHDAYQLLENVDVDIVVPMDVYLDDYNVVNQGPVDSEKTPVSSTSNGYPVAGKTDPNTDFDALGMVYVEEYQGTNYYWWRFSTSGATADIYPVGAGSASATTKADGTALTAADFHEVNFGYDLARFLFDVSENTSMTLGTIGVRPPASFSLKDVALWIGTAPTVTIAPNGDESIAATADNGTGLLGHKMMGGAAGYKAGLPGGGMILTDGSFVDDGAERKDSEGNVVDIGKYLSVTAQWATLFNDFDVNGLGTNVNIAAAYGGMISTLAPKSAPTNKVLPSARLPFRVAQRKLDQLAAAKYVMLQNKTKGITVTAANTASRTTGDYRFLTTFRIVKSVVETIRDKGDAFIGEAGGALQRVALETTLNSAMGVYVKNGDVQRYNLKVTATRDEVIQGIARVSLEMVPAFEVRKILLTITLRAV